MAQKTTRVTFILVMLFFFLLILFITCALAEPHPI